MNKELMTINMVKDGKPTTVTMGIADLVEKVDIIDPFFDVIVKQGGKLKLKNDARGEEFIISKHDELKAYVNANKKDGTTLEELKALISCWIEEQDRIADQMEQVEEIETAKQRNMAKFKDERHWKVYKGVEKYINLGTVHVTFKELMMIIDPEHKAAMMLLKWAEFYDLRQGDRTDAFSRAKWIALDEFLDENATTDPMTLEEAASLIPKWIECEEMELAREAEKAKST